MKIKLNEREQNILKTIDFELKTTGKRFIEILTDERYKPLIRKILRITKR